MTADPEWHLARRHLRDPALWALFCLSREPLHEMDARPLPGTGGALARGWAAVARAEHGCRVIEITPAGRSALAKALARARREPHEREAPPRRGAAGERRER